jgi:hypothetical protein
MDDFNDIDRIKKRINILTNGSIISIINLALNSFVTLEISNGIEKITIQQILKDLLNRFKILNNFLDELIINKDIDMFKKKVYKLFNLTDVIKFSISKYVSFGFLVNKILNMFSTSLDIISNKLVDDIFFLHTDQEYMDYIETLVDERFFNIDKKDMLMEKIKFMSNILSKHVGIEIELNTMENTQKNISIDNNIYDRNN